MITTCMVLPQAMKFASSPGHCMFGHVVKTAAQLSTLLRSTLGDCNNHVCMGMQYILSLSMSFSNAECLVPQLPFSAQLRNLCHVQLCSWIYCLYVAGPQLVVRLSTNA